MKTDKERLIELLESFGMKRSETLWGDDWIEIQNPGHNEVHISVGDGCAGGMAFRFDAMGKFKGYGGFPW